ncbi:hypothetical protein BESB_073650 [Besnoitia besnoiti]|uniref:WDHD1/CFT4 second beta-propeller domain-containing protein n=1 Tax=Besnoitia besnoiti TaxID=94643 RepID=A0A2A9MEW0_BESBE|nr:uncharacterized protein BESB_073650 [Besnoitia besnoiti]PFH34213.1 hypothetical protein BESB_073650 [Besnoitia besnoiti]
MATSSSHTTPTFLATSWQPAPAAPAARSSPPVGSAPQNGARVFCIPGPPLAADRSCSLFTCGSQTGVTRLQPLFRTDGLAEADAAADHCSASFSLSATAAVAVAQSAGSPVVAVVPIDFSAMECRPAGMTAPEEEREPQRFLPAFPVVVGLENGQVWLYEWQQAEPGGTGGEASPSAPKCVAQHLLCRQMAKPITICIANVRRNADVDDDEEDSQKYRFEAYVLYSNGMVVVWKKGRRDRKELGPVEGAVHMSVEAEGRYIAVSSSTRKLVVFRRKEAPTDDDFLSFSKCFDQEVFRKQLNSACAAGVQLQTSWHPDGDCLFLPGASSVRMLKTSTMAIESLDFASSGFDPLVVFDRVAVVRLSPLASSPRHGEATATAVVLLASVRSSIRAWAVEQQQPLFYIEAGSNSSSSNGDRLLQIAAWRSYSGASNQAGHAFFSPALEIALVREDGAISIVGVRSQRLLEIVSKSTETSGSAATSVEKQVKSEPTENVSETNKGVNSGGMNAEDEETPEAEQNVPASPSGGPQSVEGASHEAADSASPPRSRSGGLSPSPVRMGAKEHSDAVNRSVSEKSYGEKSRDVVAGTPMKKKHDRDSEDEGTRGRRSASASVSPRNGEKKKRKERKNAADSTPVRRFIEMQAEEASEHDDENDGEQLFGAAGEEDGEECPHKGQREKRKRKALREERHKKRRKQDGSPLDGEDAGSALSDFEKESDAPPLDEEDEEDDSLHTLLSSFSFLSGKDGEKQAAAGEAAADGAHGEAAKDAASSPRSGEKALLETMRKALLQLHSRQKEGRKEQLAAKRRTQRLQRENARLRAELHGLRRTHQALLARGYGLEEGRRGWEVHRAVTPGACKQPGDAATPWCLFWNQHGHVTKTTAGDKTTLEIFNFSPAAALSGTSRKRITDYTSACMAALSKVGVALASVGSTRPLLPSRVEFRSLQDSSQWTKTLPVPERPLGVALGDSFVAVVTSSDLLRIFSTSGIALSLTRLPGVPVAVCASHQLLFVVVATTAASAGEAQHQRQRRRPAGGRDAHDERFFFSCMLLHVHPPPSAPTAPYLLPFGCRDRVAQLPALMAKAFPAIDVIHEGPLVLNHPLDWVNISTGGMPSVKDTSGQVWSLLPSWGRAMEGPVPYSLSWLPIVNLFEAAGGSLQGDAPPPSIKFWPLYVDEAKGEIMVVRLKASKLREASSGDAEEAEREAADGVSSGVSSRPPQEPSCAVAAPMFGYTVEQLPLRLPFTDVWPYMRWRQLLLKDKNLKGVVAQTGSSKGDAAVAMGEAALVPWHQFDEVRMRNEVVLRFVCVALRNWEGGGAGGGAGGPENQQDVLKMEQAQESVEAEKRFMAIVKNHDKFALREFLACREDRRLHPAALDVAVRFKMPNVASHARESLNGDTRMQVEKLREALEWQESEGLLEGAGALSPPPVAAGVGSLPASQASFSAHATRSEIENQHPAFSKRRPVEEQGGSPGSSPRKFAMRDPPHAVAGKFGSGGKAVNPLEAPERKSWMRAGSRSHQKFSAFRQAD